MLRVEKMDITVPEVAQEVLDIQKPAYKIEAEIIGNYEIPTLRDTAASLQECGETFYGCYLNDTLKGVISIIIVDDIMEICRLFVHPNSHQKRIATRLLDFVQMNEKIKRINVSTGSKNIPAIHFYLKNGFVITKETEVAEGLTLTHFRKFV